MPKVLVLCVIFFWPDWSYCQQLVQLIRQQRAVEYYGNYVNQSYWVPVRRGEKFPENAVRPFDRPLKYSAIITKNQFVALWIPDKQGGVFGRAWNENGTVKAVFYHNNTIKTSEHPDLAKGYRILRYTGGSEANGFRFVWKRVKDADPASILFSGENLHASIVVVEDSGQEVMGDAEWPMKKATVVDYGEKSFFHMLNDATYKGFDQHIYVLTKQRCQCQC